MLRVIGGVVTGYLVMGLLVFLTFTALYSVLGAEGAFLPGTYELTWSWMVASLVVNVVAALAGGFVSISVGGNLKAATILSSAVLALGLMTALTTMNRPATDPPLARTGVVGNLEAAQRAREPGWMTLSNPIIGAAGVLLGARLKNRS